MCAYDAACVVVENLLLLSEARHGVRNRREKRYLRASFMCAKCVYVYSIYVWSVTSGVSSRKPEAFQPLSHCCKTRREEIIYL